MRQESFEDEMVGCQSGIDESRHESRRAGQTLDLYAAFYAFADEHETRVGDGRSAGVGDKSHALAVGDTLGDALHDNVFVVKMKRLHRLAYLIVFQQVTAGTGVFRKNHIHLLAQHTQGPQGDVLKVADGRWNEI